MFYGIFSGLNNEIEYCRKLAGKLSRALDFRDGYWVRVNTVADDTTRLQKNLQNRAFLGCTSAVKSTLTLQMGR